MKRKLQKADCRRGAPMGRNPTILFPDSESKFHLCKLRIDSGGYDSGGCYFGIGGDDIFWAYDSDGQEVFCRAVNREDAKAQVLSVFKKAKFYR